MSNTPGAYQASGNSPGAFAAPAAALLGGRTGPGLAFGMMGRMGAKG